MKLDVNEKDFFDFYKSGQPHEEVTDEEPEIIMRPRKKNNFPAIAIGLVALFAGLAWLGYLLFGGISQHIPVVLSVDGPTEVASGAEVLYMVKIVNREGSPLTDTSLIGSFPEGFEFTYASEDPKNGKKNYWTLGSIDGYSQKVITLRGTLSGAKNEDKEISFAFEYHQRGVSAEFGTTAKASTKITTSALALHLTGPSQLTAGEEGTYTITYDSFDTYSKKDSVQIRVTPPPGFQVASTSPTPEHGLIWTSQVLVKNIDSTKKSGSIVIKGSFPDMSADVKTMAATIGIDTGGSFVDEQLATIDTVLAGSDFKARLLLNGSDQARALQLDAPIEISIPFENAGDTMLTNLTASLEVSSPILDWLTIKNPQNGIIKDGKVVWTEREVSALKLLKPREKVEIKLVLHLKSAEQIASLPDEVKSLDPYSFSSTLTITGTKLQGAGDKVGEQPLSVKPLTLASLVSSDAGFSSQLTYYTPERIALGAGPVPPKVGEQTRYRAVWMVSNSLHELSDLHITAHVPKGVTWVDNSALQAGTILFDQKTRTITWTLNRMPQSVKSIKTEFEISITPQSENVGKTLSLLEKPTFTATDKKTNGPITISASDETSNLDDDLIAKGMGVVEK
ncbi:MAG: hypothetical protein Q7S47_01470 [bacterium]|nr:hypothetical protein [bacterium]